MFQIKISIQIGLELGNILQKDSTVSAGEIQDTFLSKHGINVQDKMLICATYDLNCTFNRETTSSAARR